LARKLSRKNFSYLELCGTLKSAGFFSSQVNVARGAYRGPILNFSVFSVRKKISVFLSAFCGIN